MSEMRRVYVVYFGVVNGEIGPRLVSEPISEVRNHREAGYSDTPAEAWKRFGEAQEAKFQDLIDKASQCRQWMGIAAQQIQQLSHCAPRKAFNVTVSVATDDTPFGIG